MKLKDLRIAIKASKRMGGKVPAPLLNYQRAQFRFEQWQRKLKLAQTKVKKYRKQVTRYNKIYGRNDDETSNRR